jgi:hypothetical protein
VPASEREGPPRAAPARSVARPRSDDGDRLHRVQVKTTTRRSPGGRFLVQLCTRGGNRSFHTTKYFDPGASDLLYVLTDDRTRYLIPTAAVRARAVLTLNGRFDAHRL